MGLEKVVKLELKRLGYEKTRIINGRVEIEATLSDIPRLNIWLRTAERILIKMGQFKATTFESLFDQCNVLPWENFITVDGSFNVDGKSVKSTLGSIRACQSIVKKAIVERLKSVYKVDWFREIGPSYAVQIAMFKDVALLTLDTSGIGLHKRGYRTETGEAPLKETLAASLVELSFWRPDRLLLDPLCGSGTILIEAAMIGRNIAPGLDRRFAADQWPIFPEGLWQEEKAKARAAIDRTVDLNLIGHDSDPETLATARENALRAGVGDDIHFSVKDIHKLWIDRQYGIVITNPPYGLRLDDLQGMNKIYIALNKMFRKKSGWSVYVLTADKKFPDFFKRGRPNRVRKLFNGNIEANYYQYHGERPPIVAKEL